MVKVLHSITQLLGEEEKGTELFSGCGAHSRTHRRGLGPSLAGDLTGRSTCGGGGVSGGGGSSSGDMELLLPRKSRLEAVRFCNFSDSAAFGAAGGTH